MKMHHAFIDSLDQQGCLTTPAIYAAFRAIPRHLFLPDIPLEQVYSDHAIPTKFDEQTAISSSSQPSLMAKMLEQLDLHPGQRILEIGAGTGYNAALIAHIVGSTGQVITLDVDEELVATAQAHLQIAGFPQVQVMQRDGHLGYADSAPYDRIIVTAGTWDIPLPWLEQLGPEGRLVIPLGIRNSMTTFAFIRANRHLVSISAVPSWFMPLRGVQAVSNPMQEFELSDGLVFQVGMEQPCDINLALVEGDSYDILTEVIFDGSLRVKHALYVWLSLHDTRTVVVGVTGEWLGRNIIPFYWGNIDQSYASIGLAAGPELALLGRILPKEPHGKYGMFVRTFGTDRVLAGQLLALVSHWQAAGQPEFEDCTVKVYAHNENYVAQAHEVSIMCPSVQIVISYTTTFL